MITLDQVSKQYKSSARPALMGQRGHHGERAGDAGDVGQAERRQSGGSVIDHTDKPGSSGSE
jgi:hypothetical protein